MCCAASSLRFSVEMTHVTSPALALYESLTAYERVEELIEVGEAEGQLLECKAPQSPNLDKGLKAQLSWAVSGFANAGGGVILWGMSTDNHLHSGLDLLTQIQPIGNARTFALKVDRMISTLTLPSVTCPPSRVLYAEQGNTKGVMVTYVPTSSGDPVQALEDRRFYLRVGGGVC
jgi:predicted HTH transcriptional regulator